MKRIWIAAMIASLFTIAGIAQSEIVVLDQTGQTVTIPQPIESIASVYGVGTYYVYALGGGERLVVAYYIGVKTISSASESMLRWEPRLPDILSFGDPNVEELVASNAQLVLADGSQHQAVAEQLRELGIPVVLYQAETAQALKEAVALTGTILGSDAGVQAAEFVADYDRIIDTVASDVAALSEDNRVRVLFLGTSLTKVISGGMYQSYLIEVAGGISVTRELPGFWNEVNLEQILLWNPEIIVIPPYGPVQPGDILDNPDWQTLAAVQSGRVHRMPRIIAPMDTPVPESLLGIAWMAKTFYPDLVTLDLEAEVTHFYTEYYQFALTDEEIDQLISP
ncbi:ABC transporter substrate-binding protein [Candidatus Bipolaricaulota bacterium]